MVLTNQVQWLDNENLEETLSRESLVSKGIDRMLCKVIATRCKKNNG